MEKTILLAAIAGAVLVGAFFAAMQPIDPASASHARVCRQFLNMINGTGASAGGSTHVGDYSNAEITTVCGG